MRSITSRLKNIGICGSSNEVRALRAEDLINEDLIYQTALASLTNKGAELTRVTLFGPQHAVAIAHYVDEYQDNCKLLKFLVTGVPGYEYSCTRGVKKVTSEPKSDPNIRKEDDYRVAVITVSFTLNSSLLTIIISWITFYSKIFKYNTKGFLHMHTPKKYSIGSKKIIYLSLFLIKQNIRLNQISLA